MPMSPQLSKQFNEARDLFLERAKQGQSGEFAVAYATMCQAEAQFELAFSLRTVVQRMMEGGEK